MRNIPAQLFAGNKTMTGEFKRISYVYFISRFHGFERIFICDTKYKVIIKIATTAAEAIEGDIFINTYPWYVILFSAFIYLLYTNKKIHTILLSVDF